MADDTQASSPAIRVLFGELLRHKRLAISTLIVAVLDSALVFGVVPYLVSLFSEKVAMRPDTSFSGLVWAAAGIAAADAVLFLLKVRWRRQLTARGRTGLSERLNGALAKADAGTSRQASGKQGDTQKMQDAWMDLTFQLTETFIPFVSGSVCLLVFVALRAPLFIIPILVLVAIGMVVSWASSRDFNAKNHELSDAATRERNIFDAMFAVPKMKWLIEKLAPLRQEASRAYEATFYRQAKRHAQYQSLLLAFGGILKVASIASGPTLIAMGYGPSTAVLIALLGYALGDKFVTVTVMLCSYDWILFRARPVATFVQHAENQKVAPPLPACATRDGVTYTFRNARGIYGSGDDHYEVPVPDVSFSPGITLVMGLSGTGKTTLLGMADGSVTYEGSVSIGGFEVRDWDISGKIVNASQSFGEMDVPLEKLLGDDEKARELALQLAAYPEANLSKSIGSLSGGQRRRAMLAAVTYQVLTGGFDDGVLFVDEPTNHLGPHEIKMLVAGFRRLADWLPNLTIVITTHQGMLVRLADQLIVLHGDGTATTKWRRGGKLVASDNGQGGLAP